MSIMHPVETTKEEALGIAFTDSERLMLGTALCTAAAVYAKDADNCDDTEEGKRLRYQFTRQAGLCQALAERVSL